MDMAQELKVTIQPSGRSVFVLPDTILLEAVARAGTIIETPCGGAGKCGKCLVHIIDGECAASSHEADVLTTEQIDEGYRLACHARVQSDLIVEIPQTSVAQSGQKILANSDATAPVEVSQCATMKQYVELPDVDREHPLSDVERLEKAIGAPVDMDLRVLRSLPHVFREGGSGVTVTMINDRLLHVESGNRADECYGIAFDIGTTTIVGTLVSLTSGEDKAVASMINPQISAGDDVVARIKKCREEADGLEQLHEMIVGAINDIVGELTKDAGVDRQDVCRAVFAGNTTMQEILCGVNPFALGELPFVPVLRHQLHVLASDIGVEISNGGTATIFPNIGGFVGGDTVAGVLSTKMADMDEPALFVDVGTNGELVLAKDGELVATSVAAGPAFEGARIVTGMRASSGAIEKVMIDDDVHVNVIGNAKAVGLCGTGLVDTVASLLTKGVIDCTGRIVDPDELPDDTSDAIRNRIIELDGQNHFILVHQNDSGLDKDLCLYQKDVRELQLANGAIRAGINILLKMAGLESSDLGCILLAGAFGNFIRRKNAKRIGMLPDIPTERIRFVGNTASFGARSVLLSVDEQRRADRIAAETRHIDLSMSPEFQMEFSAAMIFPE